MIVYGVNSGFRKRQLGSKVFRLFGGLDVICESVKPFAPENYRDMARAKGKDKFLFIDNKQAYILLVLRHKKL